MKRAWVALGVLILVSVGAIATAPIGATVEGGQAGLATEPQPPLPPYPEPNTFEGSVTIDGQPAPDGTLVVGVVDGVLCDTNLTMGGRYRLVVEVFRCGSPGDVVRFAAWAGFAAETAVLVSPLFTRTLDLTIGAAGPASARLLGVSTACSRNYPGRARITFMWDASLGEHLWLDLSIFDNGFRPGTFIGAGPFPVSLEPYGLESGSFTWDDLAPTVRHFWRVNAVQAGYWAPSATASFVTPDCRFERPGAATQMDIWRQECAFDEKGTRIVTFTWLPAIARALPELVREQWLDISIFDNNFAPGTYVGIPVPKNVGVFVVRGITGSARHYWRINTFAVHTWNRSNIHYFDAIQCPNQTLYP